MRELIPMRWPAGWDAGGPLELLRDSPVNCLIVPDSATEAAAKQAGFVAMPEAAVATSAPGVWIEDAVWPGVKPASRGEAGPTGAPWVDANSWRADLERARHPGKPIWLAHRPPKDKVVADAAYALAVADAAAAGARWVAAFTPEFSKRLAARQAEAIAAWKNAAAAMRMFNPPAAEPRAILGVLSDFQDANEFLATEALNLSARRQLPCRVLLKGKPFSLQGLQAVLYVDVEPPDAALRKRLGAFVGSGGMLIARQETAALFKGRVEAFRDEWQDPWVMVADVHALLGRRRDVIRLWNGGALEARYFVSPDGAKAAVHLVNYTMRSAGHPVTLGLAERYRRARFRTIGSEKEVEGEARPLGMEWPLPPFQVCATIELAR